MKKLGYLLRGIRGMSRGTGNLILRASDGASLKPRWLWLEITDRCNSHCMQCNIWRKEPTRNVLSPQEIEKALSDPLFKDVECILNAGGEPSLRDDLEEIVLAEHEAIPEAAIQLSTNGLLPERIISVVRTAIKNKIVIYVGTSLDGIGEGHDSIRGVKGNFAKVEWLLRELSALSETHKNGFPCFGFTLIDRTLPHLEEVRRYAQKRKIGFLIQWYNQSPFFNNTGKELVSNKASMVRAIRSYPPSLLNETGLKWLKGKPIKFRCFAMHTFCMLHCNGDLSPCLGRWDLSAGNVREAHPSEIWQGGAAKAIRRNVKNCGGCLNSCGIAWSAESSFYPNLLFNIKHKFFAGGRS